MPNPPDIATFPDLYQHAVSDRHWLGPFLSGHLMVEFMLRKLAIQHDGSITARVDKMRHFQLIELNSQIGTISASQKDVLVAINQMRNKLAHEITYDPTIDEMRAMWLAAAAAFSDLTDGISQGLGEMDVEGKLRALDSWVFSELFVQIAYDLHHAFIDMGGDHEVFAR